MKRKLASIFFAWILFIGIDFFFHAGVLASWWKEDLPGLKPLTELAKLIPAGYLSFLLLTVLAGFIFFKVFPKEPANRDLLIFAGVFSSLFSLSNFFALYSFVRIPVAHLALFNLVYFIEINAVVFTLSAVQFTSRLKNTLGFFLLLFFIFIFFGIIIQNM